MHSREKTEGWGAGESRNGERAKFASSESGQTLLNLELSRECSFQGPLWRRQSALNGSELRPAWVLCLGTVPVSFLCPLWPAGPAFHSYLPSLGYWSTRKSSCSVRPAHTPCLPRSLWLCGLGPLSGGFNTASSSTHQTPTSLLLAPPRVSSGAGPRAWLHDMWQGGLCRSRTWGVRGLYCWWEEGPRGFGLGMS